VGEWGLCGCPCRAPGLAAHQPARAVARADYAAWCNAAGPARVARLHAICGPINFPSFAARWEKMRAVMRVGLDCVWLGALGRGLAAAPAAQLTRQAARQGSRTGYQPACSEHECGTPQHMGPSRAAAVLRMLCRSSGRTWGTRQGRRRRHPGHPRRALRLLPATRPAQQPQQQPQQVAWLVRWQKLAGSWLALRRKPAGSWLALRRLRACGTHGCACGRRSMRGGRASPGASSPPPTRCGQAWAEEGQGGRGIIWCSAAAACKALAVLVASSRLWRHHGVRCCPPSLRIKGGGAALTPTPCRLAGAPAGAVAARVQPAGGAAPLLRGHPAGGPGWGAQPGRGSEMAGLLPC